VLWCHAQCCLTTQVSGATATVAVIVGWDLVVASVGDSTAYLDTGAEVVQVSLGFHILLCFFLLMPCLLLNPQSV